MRSIFLIFALIVSFDARSQRISINDLKYVLYHTVDETEDYLFAKGFSYAGITDLEDVSSNDYSKFPKTSDQYISVSKYICNGFTYQSYLFTAKQTDYTSLKQQVKNLKFKLVKTQRDKQSTIYTFAKGNLEIDFEISIASFGVPIYAIFLRDVIQTKRRWLYKKNEEVN